MRRLLEVLRQRREDILRALLFKLRVNHPELRDEVLKFGIDDFLDELIAGLEAERRGEPLPSPGKMLAASRHGEQRRGCAYDPASVVRDYGCVGDAAFEIAQEEGIQVSAREFQLFNRYVDAAGADAITAYWQKDKQDDRRHTVEHVGTLAHELRNSLGSALLALDRIQSDRAQASGRSSSILRAALDRMQQLIAGALLEVRAAGRVGRIARERLNLIGLLRDIIDGMLVDRGVSVELRGEASLEIEGDAQLLTSALSNLMQNAVKFTRAGGLVTIRAFQRGHATLVEVQDECGGLPDGLAEELFAPFVQKGANRSGVGLGLSIARVAVRAHGGSIRVRNLPGRGCIFVVDLPDVAVRAPSTLGMTSG